MMNQACTKIIDDEEYTFIGRGYLKVYACCTNFADAGSRIRNLFNKHGDDMFMLKPIVISLISCEINLERIILENSNLFPKRSLVEWKARDKCYDIQISTGYLAKAKLIFEQIGMKASKERFQGYQIRIDGYSKKKDIKMNDDITNYINDIDVKFFSDTKPFCQQYINSYVIEDNHEWKYIRSDRIYKRRPDLNNENHSVLSYSLYKIKNTMDDHNANDHIKHMTESGIISKEDIPTLKALAKAENIEIPQELEDY